MKKMIMLIKKYAPSKNFYGLFHLSFNDLKWCHMSLDTYKIGHQFIIYQHDNETINVCL